MVKKATRGIKTSQGTNYKITIIHKLGPYHNTEEARKAKASVKSKVKHVTFSGLTQNSRGLTFETKASYVKKIPGGVAPSVIAAYIKKEAPGAKVSVTRA